MQRGINASSVQYVNKLTQLLQYIDEYVKVRCDVKFDFDKVKDMRQKIFELYQSLSSDQKWAFLFEVSRRARAIVPHTPQLESTIGQHHRNSFLIGIIGGSLIGMGAALLTAEVSGIAALCLALLEGNSYGVMLGAGGSCLYGIFNICRTRQWKEKMLGSFASSLEKYTPYDDIQELLNIKFISVDSPLVKMNLGCS